MLTLTLTRTNAYADRTIGMLDIDDQHFCHTLEPALRPARPASQEGVWAIPAGWYRMELTMSPRFHRLLPILRYVPGRTGIRIHAGNTPKDTRGCILVGHLFFSTADPDADAAAEPPTRIPRLVDSRRTEDALVKRLLPLIKRHEEIWIDIRDPTPITCEY